MYTVRALTSSNTTYVHCESTKYLFSNTSIRRPGVAITISQPILNFRLCSSREIPPIMATVFIPNKAPNLLDSSSICCANSRVGARIIAYGPLSRSSNLHQQENETIGIVKKIKKLLQVKRLCSYTRNTPAAEFKRITHEKLSSHKQDNSK